MLESIENKKEIIFYIVCSIKSISIKQKWFFSDRKNSNNFETNEVKKERYLEFVYKRDCLID